MKLTGRFAWVLVLVVFSLLLIVPHSQAAEGTWVQKKNMACARAYAQVAAVGGQLYVAGGLKTATGLTLAPRLEVYNPYSNTWVTKKAMSGGGTVAVHSGAAVELNNKLYVIGGYTGYPGVLANKTDKTQIYDPSTNTWSQGPTVTDPVASSAAAVLNNKIYVLAENPDDLGKKILYVFDPAAEGGDGSWSSNAYNHAFLSGATLQAIDGKLYAVGGQTGGVASNQVDVFDPATGLWATPDPTPDMTARFDLASGVINGRLYAVGGHTGVDEVGAPPVYSAKLEAFDKVGPKWATKADLPAPARKGLGAAVINGKLYVVGGQGVTAGPLPDEGTTTLSRRLDVFTPMQVSINILAPTWGNEVGVDGQNWMIILRLVYQASSLAEIPGLAAGSPGYIPGLVVLIPSGNAANPNHNLAYPPGGLHISNFTNTAINHIGPNQIEVLTTWFVTNPDILGNGTDAALYAAVVDYDPADTTVADANSDGVLNDQDIRALWLASDVAQVSFNINTLEELKKK